MFLRILISWLFPIVVILYLVSLMKFVSEVKKSNAEYWRSIGSPDLWGVSGQATILKKVFLPNQFPEEIAGRYKVRLYAIRILAFVGLGAFSVILLMIWLGMFEP